MTANIRYLPIPLDIGEAGIPVGVLRPVAVGADNLAWDDTWAQRGPVIPGGSIGGTTFVTMWRHNYEGTKGWVDWVP